MADRKPQMGSMFSGLKKRIGGTFAVCIIWFIFLILYLWFVADVYIIGPYKNWAIFLLSLAIVIGIIGGIFATMDFSFGPGEKEEPTEV
jgi:hypothetical protein